MRTIAAAVAMGICVLLSAPALAQNKAIPDPGPERQKWLDAILTNWEAAMTQVKSLKADDCERTDEDKVYKTKEVYRGTAKYLKGDGPGQPSRASLYLAKADNPKIFEQLVYTGTHVYMVVPASKEIKVQSVPQPKPGENVDHNLLGLLFGMKAVEAKQRYNIELVHADEHYFYLQIDSKRPEDKADFSKAQLTLLRKTYLPRQLQLYLPNSNRTTWDLPKIETPANVRAVDFAAPNLPTGWKMSPVPTSGPAPNKVRSAGGN